MNTMKKIEARKKRIRNQRAQKINTYRKGKKKNQCYSKRNRERRFVYCFFLYETKKVRRNIEDAIFLLLFYLQEKKKPSVAID